MRSCNNPHQNPNNNLYQNHPLFGTKGTAQGQGQAPSSLSTGNRPRRPVLLQLNEKQRMQPRGI
jgi:hypothetical protein